MSPVLMVVPDMVAVSHELQVVGAAIVRREVLVMNDRALAGEGRNLPQQSLAGYDPVDCLPGAGRERSCFMPTSIAKHELVVGRAIDRRAIVERHANECRPAPGQLRSSLGRDDPMLRGEGQDPVLAACVS